MQRHSRALSGVLATVLGLALTACGGSGDRNESGGSKDRGARSDSGQVASGGRQKSPRKPVEWTPALTMGQPAPKLFEPEVSGGGQFQVAASKIVKGTPEQMREGHYSDDEMGGGTPYFVFVAYTLKSGVTDNSNPDLNANAAILDKDGEPAAERPVVHAGTVEGGCPVGDVYMGWDVGETHTLCSVFIGDPSKQPARLAWSTDAETPDEYKKGSSWEWVTQ
ncbi:hypothetical protein OG512_05990 [Streptomyces sp. NBC_01378]|uniref:hypothetical protein n=1 Tax=Streptomyces sp. NBC_01378 TaxID=2903844 RepID=UPI003252A2F1